MEEIFYLDNKEKMIFFIYLRIYNNNSNNNK